MNEWDDGSKWEAKKVDEGCTNCGGADLTFTHNQTHSRITCEVCGCWWTE
jgi:ribosomal protein S27E